MGDGKLLELAQSLAPAGIGIYSARVLPASGGFHFEVVLDGLEDPRGAVSLAQCESYSRDFAACVDRELAAGVESVWMLENLAPGLNAENYSIEVSSAGAERRLRLPEDLERFQGQPMRFKLPVTTAEGAATIEVRLLVFLGVQGDEWCFGEYVPRGKRASRVRRRREKREARRQSKQAGRKKDAMVAAEGQPAQGNHNTYLENETSGTRNTESPAGSTALAEETIVLRLNGAALGDEKLRANLYLDY